MKKSFLLYTDQIEIFKALSDDQRGALIMHVFDYNMNGHTIPDISDPVLSMAFTAIKMSMDRDIEKYDSIVERNRINGLLGGRPPKEPKKPSGLINNPKNPEEPKKADSDSGSGSGSEKPKKRKKEYSQQFLEFYQAYPNHSAKAEAYKAWNKIDGKGELLPTMLQSIKDQAAHKIRLKDRGEFCPEWPNPSTWLNQARWEDEVMKELKPTAPRQNTAWKDKLNGWAGGGIGDE